MDNITHSLTGALAAKIVETSKQSAEDQKGTHRVLFWLMVLCANLPDADALLNLVGDPFFVINQHRGLTHSLLFAPVLSFFPALLAYRFSSFKNLKALWMTALVGVYLHIFFDVVTTFGTQLFAPLSAERYSLDWMFIIDPIFTGIMALTLFLVKRASRHRKAFALAGGLFVISYLLLEMVSHQVAYYRLKETVREQRIAAQKISALPQPLSIFRWTGLVQTEEAVLQSFFSLFDTAEKQVFAAFPQARDSYVDRALQTHEAVWFMRFARHPWIQSIPQAEGHLVEIRDRQFSSNPELTRALGFAERQPPFVLRFQFSSDGALLSTTFNE